MQNGKVIRKVRPGCFDCGSRGLLMVLGRLVRCACNPPRACESDLDTAPIPKLDPEMRPNVPPRMM